MKILMVSRDGESLSLGHALVREGHEVKFYIKSGGFQYTGLGIVQRETAFRPFLSLSWANLVISDSYEFGHLQDLVKGKNVPFIGFNPTAALLGTDGPRMLQVFNRLEIPYPPTHTFDTPVIAEDLVEDWPTLGYVVRPVYLGEGKPYTCKTPEEYMYALSNYSGHVPIMGQEVIDGVDIRVQGWFNGSDWVKTFLYIFEERRFLDGNRGANTICMGSVVVPAVKEGVLIELLRRLTPFLTLAEYKGPIDLCFVVDGKTPYVKAITMDFTYDAMDAFVGLVDENVGEFLYDIAMGEIHHITFVQGFGMAIRLTLPPYPDPMNSEIHGRPLPNNLQNDECFLLEDCYRERIMQTGEKGLFWAASNGVIAKAVGHGNSVKAVAKDLYGKIAEVDIPDLQFRGDIGGGVEQDLKRLRKSGVI